MRDTKATAIEQAGVLVTESSTSLGTPPSTTRTIIIQNQSDSNSVYVKFGGTAVADSTSLLLGPGKSFYTNTIDILPGAIEAICEAALTAEVHTLFSEYSFFN